MRKLVRGAIVALAAIITFGGATACGTGAKVGDVMPDGINDKAIFQLDQFGKVTQGNGGAKDAKKSFTFQHRSVAGGADSESLNVAVYAPATLKGESVYLACLTECKDEMDTISDTTLKPKEGVTGTYAKVFYHNKSTGTFKLLLKTTRGKVTDTGGRVVTQTD